MERFARRAVLMAVALVFVGSLPAGAIPVISPWGSDTFAKAIHFTGSAKPVSGSNYYTGNVNGLMQLYRGDGSARDTGIIMTPVGDGSYACTAAVYPGANYTYYFGFRNRTWDADTLAKWTDAAGAGGQRDQDVNRSRTIAIPTSATHGYYIYNAYGDKTVLGYQGLDSTVLSVSNPFIRTIGVTGDTPGTARLGGDDTHFANMDGSNPYSVSVLQTGDSAFTLSWNFDIGGGVSHVPSVHGVREFSGASNWTASAYGYTSKNYGFRIWRAALPGGVGGFNSVVFTDITSTVNGDTNWVDNNTNSFDGQSFTDSVLYQSDTRFLYTVTFYNAYGHLQNDTSRQNFAGATPGYETGTRAGAIRVFFIVEEMNEDVVFPDGRNVGRVFLTPYINGERRPDLRMPTTVIRTERRSIS